MCYLYLITIYYNIYLLRNYRLSALADPYASLGVRFSKLSKTFRSRKTIQVHKFIRRSVIFNKFRGVKLEVFTIKLKDR